MTTLSDVSVLHESTDVTEHVISYTRDHDICTGQATLSISFAKSYPSSNFSTWDRIKIYENNKRGTFRVANISNGANGVVSLDCQDESKRLTDYFETGYQVITSAQYTRTWIEYYLNAAGVSYTFVDGVGYGVLINENTTLGPATAYDIIYQLLQYSGWYLKFDADGSCTVGNLLKKLTPDYDADDDEILSINLHKDDSRLRNRCVVWGNYSTSESYWTYADVSIITPWNYDARDLRTVVVANSAIRSTGVAYDIAMKILNETAEILYTKTIVVAGSPDVEVGDVIHINSKYFHGSGLLTSLQVQADKDGLVTTMTLDEKCSRLYGYFGFIDYVYFGTDTLGVWRKLFDEPTYESFSLGIDIFDQRIDDLMIKNNVFVTTGGGVPYTRFLSSATWSGYHVGGLEDAGPFMTYIEDALESTACDLHDYTHDVGLMYRLDQDAEIALGYSRTWYHQITPVTHEVATVEDEPMVGPVFVIPDDGSAGYWQDIHGFDVEQFGEERKFIVGQAPIEYMLGNRQALFGTRNVSPATRADPSSFCYGPIPNDEQEGGYLEWLGAGFGNSISFVDNLFMSISKYDQFSLYNFDTMEDAFDTVLTDGLLGFDSYWPHSEERVYIRHFFKDQIVEEDMADGTGDKPYHVMDITFSGPNADAYNYSHYEVSPLKVYSASWDRTNVLTTEQTTLSGVQTIDGVLCLPNSVVFCIGQDNPTENGEYYVGVNNWMRTGQVYSNGLIVQPDKGTDNRRRCWQLAFFNEDGTPNTELEDDEILLGVTNLIFYEVLIVEKVQQAEIINVLESTNLRNSTQPLHSTKFYTPLGLHDNVMMLYKIHYPDPAQSPDDWGNYYRYGYYNYGYFIANAEGGISTGWFDDPIFYDLNQAQMVGRIMMETEAIPVNNGLGILSIVHNFDDTVYDVYSGDNGDADDEECVGRNVKIHAIKRILSCGMFRGGGIPTKEDIEISTFYGALDISNGGTPPDEQEPWACSACLNYNHSSFRDLKMAWTGVKINGGMTDSVVRLTYKVTLHLDSVACARWCRVAVEQRVDLYVVVVMYMNNGYEVLANEMLTTNLECVGCTYKGSGVNVLCVVPAQDYIWDFEDDFDYTAIHPLQSRHGYFFFRNPNLIYDGVSGSVYHTLSHNTGINMLCRQDDDFDGGWYICEAGAWSKPVSQVWKDFPAGGSMVVGAILDGFVNLPQIVSSVCAHGVVINQREQDYYGTSSVHKLDESFILQGLRPAILFADKVTYKVQASGWVVTDFDFYEFELEASKLNSPLVSHTRPPALCTFEFGGITYNPISPENFKVYDELTWKGAPFSGCYNDVRTMTFRGSVGDEDFEYGLYAVLPTRSGTIDIIDVANPIKATTFYNFNEDPEAVQLDTIQIETTNYWTNPYMWVAMGIDASTLQQKDAGVSTFEDQPGHPFAENTIIRCDDRV